MISKEKAQKYIESKKSLALTKGDLAEFSKSYKFLGTLIAQLDQTTYYNHRAAEDNLAKYFELFGTDYTHNPWTNREGKKLARLLFGAHQAPYIADSWKLANKLPFQQNWYRRSFRAKPNKHHVEKKLNDLRNLYYWNDSGFKNMDLVELAQYSVYNQNYAGANAYILSAALMSGKEEPLKECIHEILTGEDEVGGVAKGLIKALLITEDPDNWAVVEKLLLAAQRQEGLRQIILESLDETSVGAIRHFVNVILEENLMRFSSVVRAVDTWYGFGWDAPKAQTIERVLTITKAYFDDSSSVAAGLASKDNLETYVALWNIGLEDVDKANAKATELLQTREKEKQILACMFISQTSRSNSDITKWINANFGNDIDVDFWTMTVRPQRMKIEEQLFQKILTQVWDVPKEGIRREGTIFSWSSYSISRHFFFSILIEHADNTQLQQLSSDLSKVPSDVRLSLARKIYPGYSAWQKTKEKNRFAFKKIAWKRALVFELLKDRNIDLVNMSIYMLQDMNLKADDFEAIENMFARKSRVLREKLIKLTSNQSVSQIEASTMKLLRSSKVDQRLAGLEILSIKKEEDKMDAFITKEISLYQERSKFSKNEQVLLDKFEDAEVSLNIDNGFGLINYDNLRPIYIPKEVFPRPKTKVSSFVGKLKKTHTPQTSLLSPELYDIPKVTNAVNELIDIFIQNKNYEYKGKTYNGTIQTYLLSNEVVYENEIIENATALERLKALPLADLWLHWYKSANLTDFELLAAVHNCNNFASFTARDKFSKFKAQYTPSLPDLNLDPTHDWQSRNRKIAHILNHLFNAFADHKTILEFQLSQLEDIIYHIPKKEDAFGEFHSYDKWYDKVNQCTLGYIDFYKLYNDEDEESLNLLVKYFDLNVSMLYAKGNGDKLQTKTNSTNAAIKTLQVEHHRHQQQLLPTWVILKLYEHDYISAEDLQFFYLLDANLMQLIDGDRIHNSQNVIVSDKARATLTPLKATLLEIELERGDMSTDATRYMGNILNVSGTQYLMTLVERLGKDNLLRGYSWQTNNSKKDSFSSLIKKCHPADGETLETFVKLASDIDIKKKRWVEVAMYAPQWAECIGQYVKLPKLNSAVWWFHAHCSEYMNAEKETIVSQYSSIDKADFIMGAVDIEWFHEAYQDIGKSNWKLVHDAAKYVAMGNGHRQVKLYSSIMLGETKIRETLAKVKDKRDKDYVRGLGLIPLSKVSREKDLMNRYDLFQNFLKQSRQFGAQRQQSEKTAVKIGMENLARNAGYDDSVRFAWAMEGKSVQEIMSKSKIEIGNAMLELVVDHQGKAEIIVTKDGKKQKSIPAKIKKDKAVKELQASKTYLRSQYSRTRKSLESAMVTEVSFSTEEIKNIMGHPVVKAMLSKLVLHNKEKGNFGFWVEDGLSQIDSNLIKALPEDRFVIAHPSHLFEHKEWSKYQSHLFDRKLVQPFKQVYRELYVVTKDEREHGSNSKRYTGHQIQPKQAAALLRGSGWTTNHYEGLQKVYHKKKIIANLYAMADWFSPADIEAPTLEQVSFHHRKDHKVILMADIDSVVFSEVMRDVDLVVSVAHVGGVDPEASHTTMEMRGVLARESARLFKLSNVEVKSRYIIIEGKLGSYSIHLGSGQVNKDGLHLSIIPVHSQHRGRVFLPFIDDDPKSAEIISKMKLLAEDYKIKDPTILAQING